MTRRDYRQNANGEIEAVDQPLKDTFVEALVEGSDLILNQEAEGARQLREVQMLPKRGTDDKRADWEAIGVTFHEDVDDLFVRVTLPAGWAIKSPHADPRHMELHDDQGQIRARIFYKAAFYDRYASCHLLSEGERKLAGVQ